MDRILKPGKLDLDPQIPGATVMFEYWLACFEDSGSVYSRGS